MTRLEILNEIEKSFYSRYGCSKNYENQTCLVEYILYYNKRSRKPLAWLQIGYNIVNDKIIGACISFFKNGERYEHEITNINDINSVITNIIKI